MQAFIEGVRAIRFGEIDYAVVGGTDSKSHFVGFLTFSKLGLLSSNGISRPFDRARDGSVLSEGACVIILENLKKAQSRNTKIYAEVSGCGLSTQSDSGSLFSKDLKILRKAMCDAVYDSKISVSDIDYICASANSHPVGDYTEAQAIKEVFNSEKPFVSSLRGNVGDMAAANAPYDIAVSAYALKEGILPPFRMKKKDELIDLNFCPEEPVKKNLRAVLVNSFDTGYSKISIVLRKCL
jgi:3-oxoacyl-[acyl-carrier-protein] synthase II